MPPYDIEAAIERLENVFFQRKFTDTEKVGLRLELTGARADLVEEMREILADRESSA